jgi:hypothetical protein
MKPSLELARQIAAAVMDQVERDRCLNSSGLAEAILARMLVCGANSAANAGDEKIISASIRLCSQISSHIGLFPTSIENACHDVLYELQRAGRMP